MNLDHLNEAQREAVTTIKDARLLLLAGAGSGKTRVITHRIAYLIENGVKPWKILAVTFTNKAAREMKERVMDLIKFEDQIPMISTFHSFCVRVLRAHISKLDGFGNDFTIYDASDSEKLVKEVTQNLGFSEKMYPSKAVSSKISELKNSLITESQYEKMSESEFREKKISEIYRAYQKALKESNALDFDDIIFKTVQIFKEHEEVLEIYQNRYEYIMIDEYQDTNHAQYVLVKMLASLHKNICVVGDDDQSIYGWRGADITNILEFEKDYENVKVIKLEQNYRSTSNILSAANSVIKNNFSRKSKVLKTDKEEGEKITFIKSDTEYDEARHIVSVIETEGNYKETAILYRQNSLSRIIEENLVRQNIPYKIFGGLRFYDRKEIKDILAYLKILYNSLDQISIRRVLNVPRRGIGPTTIDRIAKYSASRDTSLYEVLENIENLAEVIEIKPKKLKLFYDMIEDFKKYSLENKVSDLIKHIITEINYQKELGEDEKERESRMDNLNELIKKAQEWEEVAEDKTLSSFLQEVALVSDFDISSDDEYISLMTMHTAKGLEYETVFIIGFDETIFPSYMSISSGSEVAMEEERRLCYVGITRAKKKLYLSSAYSRVKNGKTEYLTPSRFLKEIDENLIDYVGKRPEVKGVSQFAGGKQFSEEVSENVVNSYKKIPSPKNKQLNYEVGEKVSHTKHGDGVIVKINPAGADYELTISFEKSERKFMAGLAKLTKLEG